MSVQNTPLTTAQEDALYAWIFSVDNSVTIVWAGSDHKRPAKPYITIGLPEGLDSEHDRPAIYHKELDTYTKEYHQACIFEVKYFANEGSRHIQNVIESADDNKTFEDLQVVDLGIRAKVDHFTSFRKLSTKHEYVEMVSFVVVTDSTRDEVIGEIQTFEFINKIL